MKTLQKARAKLFATFISRWINNNSKEFNNVRAQLINPELLATLEPEPLAALQVEAVKISEHTPTLIISIH